MSRTRLTAAERSEQVVDAAVRAFAESGYAATKTDEIARLAGVSQPYVIRLFGTKKQLFLAALHRVCDRIEEVFRAAPIEPGDSPEQALRKLGAGYGVFLEEKELPLLMLHGAAAAADPTIGAYMRERFGRSYRLIEELSGASTLEVRRFTGTGMLLTMMTAMQVAGPGAIETPWAAEILADLHAANEAGEPEC